MSSDSEITHGPARTKGLARLSELAYLAVEYLILALLPRKGPGPISRRLFRFPILLHRAGLNRLIGSRILILKTTGRRSGKERMAALGYGYDNLTNTYSVTPGWEKPADWYLNLKANPNVRVCVRGRQIECVAEILPEEVVMAQMAVLTKQNPFAARIFSKWTRVPFDGSEESLRRVARQFTTVNLRQVDPAPEP